jgi:hypothetical protein
MLITSRNHGYSFVARIVRDVISRDMVLPGERKANRGDRRAVTIASGVAKPVILTERTARARSEGSPNDQCPIFNRRV